MSKLARATLIATVTAICPALAGAAGMVAQQQSIYHKQQAQWRTVDLPPSVRKPATPPSAYSSGVKGVWVRIHNANLFFQKDVGFHAIDVVARLTPHKAGAVVDLNRPNSFSADVAHGCALVTPAQLSALFNQHILDYSPRPLNDLKITTDQGNLVINGQIKLWSWFPLFWMPLYLRGPLTLADNGDLVYDPGSIDALKIPAHGALHLLHIPLSALLSVNRPGVRISGYRIRLNVTKVFPPPMIASKPSSATVGPGGVKICFNGASDLPDVKLKPPADAGNSYIWVQAGDIAALDKLIVNAHVLLQAKDGKMLNFSIPNYKRQIATGGTLKMKSDGTLQIAIPSKRPSKDKRVAADSRPRS